MNVNICWLVRSQWDVNKNVCPVGFSMFVFPPSLHKSSAWGWQRRVFRTNRRTSQGSVEETNERKATEFKSKMFSLADVLSKRTYWVNQIYPSQPSIDFLVSLQPILSEADLECCKHMGRKAKKQLLLEKYYIIIDF